MAEPSAMPSLADLSNPSDEVLAALAALSPVPSQQESKPKTPFMSPISISTLPTMQPAPPVMTPEAKEASPDGLSTTTALMEARAHSALEAHSTLNTLSAHAAQLETQCRAQASAIARAEAARAEAVAQQAALSHDVATLSQEQQRLTGQRDHYQKRCDELLAERGLSAQQLGELARALATERAQAKAEIAALQSQVGTLGASLEEKTAACSSTEQQNAALVSDLREVTSLIDQIEGEPGFVKSRMRRRSSGGGGNGGRSVSGAAHAAALEALGAALDESEKQHSTLVAEYADAEEVRRLREENAMLENQLELLSERMYGSPAKSAARERDRMQIELERERGGRLAADEMVLRLRASLEEAEQRIAELTEHIEAEESARADLERTRRQLQAAHTNAALGLMGRSAPSRAYNPIAAPRHQFGRSAQANGSTSQRVGATPMAASNPMATPRTRGPVAARYTHRAEG